MFRKPNQWTNMKHYFHVSSRLTVHRDKARKVYKREQKSKATKNIRVIYRSAYLCYTLNASAIELGNCSYITLCNSTLTCMDKCHRTKLMDGYWTSILDQMKVSHCDARRSSRFETRKVIILFWFIVNHCSDMSMCHFLQKLDNRKFRSIKFLIRLSVRFFLLGQRYRKWGDCFHGP